MWPSREYAIIDDSVDVSMVIYALPNSTIHRKTPMSDWKYVVLIGNC